MPTSARAADRRTSAACLAGPLAALALLAAPPAARGQEAAGEPLAEEITVTATRSPRPVRDVAATVTVVPQAEIERSPAKAADELLMSVPSFDLFRRSSSLAADPSSQGVKLRGVGGTAVARTLVLLDGVPLNDPFAGWVAWRSIPTLGLSRVEVVPGGGAALYGNYALGGVVQFISRPIAPDTVLAQVEAGSFGTGRLTAFASDRSGRAGYAVDADVLAADGYRVVAPAFRGPIDQRTPGFHAVLNARGELEARDDLKLTLRVGGFVQDQSLGTESTTASLRRLEGSAGLAWTPGPDRLALTVFGHHGVFEQGRARIAAGRVSETSSGHQVVPTDDVGASLVFQPRALALAGPHALTAGVDGRWISGTTDEHLIPLTVTPGSVLHRVADGTQRLVGVFVQDVWDPVEAVEVTAAVRWDRWDNVAARRTQTNGAGDTTATPFADRSDQQVDPKLGVRVRVLDGLTARASGYRAFRAPTLDELYRPFTVGQVLTQANEALKPETLTGGEAGLDASPLGGLSVRATGFWNELKDPVTNVTIGTNLRQRQNLGQARIRGAEASADWRLGRGWLASASYTFIDATVTAAPGNPALVGKRLTQDPLWRAVVGLAYDGPGRLGGGASVRLLGPQYEDDLNTLPLGESRLVDLLVTWRATPALQLYAGVNNLLDETFLIGSQRPGVDTVGQPRYVHAGIRLQTTPAPRP